MKSFGIILSQIFCGFIPAISQNLIPNPSFEDTSGCPTYTSYTCSTVGFIDQVKYSPPWQTTTCGSPDYFNACCNNWDAGVPVNRIGYQFARTGQAYAGVMTFDSTSVLFGYGNYREYISSPLIAPLQAGKWYYAEMYISFGETSFMATDRIGMCFTVGIPDTTGIEARVLPHNPQINNPIGSIISDNLNWTKISGSFQASGNENYITIGNFSPDDSTQKLLLSPWLERWAYYFIDDVLVELIDSLQPCPPLSLSFSLTDATPGLNDGAVKINVAGGQPPYQYSLDSIAFQVNSTFTELGAGIYQVFVTDINGCTTQGTFTIASSVGFSALSNINAIKVHFASEYLIVEGVKEQTLIQLYDVLGRIVLQEKLNNTGTNRIEIKNLTNGIYVYSVIGEKNGKVFIEK